MSLKRRLGELERLKGRPGYAPSRTEIEAWALNDEIAQLEEQMKAEGLNPWPIATDGGLDGDLDQEIRLLENELEKESWD